MTVVILHVSPYIYNIASLYHDTCKTEAIEDSKDERKLLTLSKRNCSVVSRFFLEEQDTRRTMLYNLILKVLFYCTKHRAYCIVFKTRFSNTF